MKAQMEFGGNTQTQSLNENMPFMSHTSVQLSHTHSFSILTIFSVCLVLFPPVEKCMSSMQMGTQMVKLRGGSKGLVRFFYLDEHKSCIRWRPSRKNEKAKSECLLPFLQSRGSSISNLSFSCTSTYSWFKLMGSHLLHI